MLWVHESGYGGSGIGGESHCLHVVYTSSFCIFLLSPEGQSDVVDDVIVVYRAHRSRWLRKPVAKVVVITGELEVPPIVVAG